jgi:hypothetical protein
MGEPTPAERPVAPEELQGIRDSISASAIPADEKNALLKELRPNMTTAEMDKVSARVETAMGRVSAENVADQNRKAATQTAQDEKKALRDQKQSGLERERETSFEMAEHRPAPGAVQGRRVHRC